MKFSLIIPVYNVKDYLPRCLDSCLNQNIPHEEYEIIVVNDGSTDTSLYIAENYAKQFNCIKILSQPNKGLSAARNTGLQHAKGEYIWFIDSDDYITQNCLLQIYEEISRYHLDALWIKWHNENEHHKRIPLYHSTITKEDYNIFNGIDFMDSIMGIYYFAWSFIFNRSFLMKKQLLFQEGLYYEDSEFAYRALPAINKIKLFNRECYIYNIRQGSIAQTVSEKKINDLLYIAEKAFTIYNSNIHKKCFLKSATNILITAIFHSISIKYKNGIKRSKKLIKDNNIKQLMLCGSYPTRIITYIYNTIGFHGALFTAHILQKIKKMKTIIRYH